MSRFAAPMQQSCTVLRKALVIAFAYRLLTCGRAVSVLADPASASTCQHHSLLAFVHSHGFLLMLRSKPDHAPGGGLFDDYPVDRKSCQLLGPTALVRNARFRARVD